MAYTTINKSTDYFNTKLYTGNGSTNAITGVGHQPDLVWLKERSSAGAGLLFDAIRTATKFLRSSDSAAEVTAADTLTAFNSDGFTLGADAGNYAANQNSETYASWNWLANGAGSANTDGTISSTVSANTTSGFSIVSYTGTGANATVGHGLGSVVKMFFVKELSNANSWEVYHVSEGAGKNAQLNSNAAFESAGSSRWNSTAPTSTTISIGTDSGVNRSSGNYIAYCFAEKTGYSKFGSYIGNGNADGTFVYTGFKPAFVIIKSSSQAETNWVVVDNKREGYNPDNDRLFPDSTQAESTSDVVDLVSNGFKFRSGAGSSNATYSYIYMAFAEEPLVANSGTDGVPATAR